MKDQPVHLALVAIGGYGLIYLNGLLDKTDPSRFVLDGVVDPWPQNCPRLAELQARSIPVYPSLEEFYRHHQTDLVLVSSPIQNHAPDTVTGLAHGSHVLCEKPLGATVQEAQTIIEASQQHGKLVAVGYQWSYNQAVLQLKRDFHAGLFGAAKKLKTIVLWPRDEKYFNRNNWAGKIKDEAGRWVLDSPANNAAAHYLHNMFFVLGDTMKSSARPINVQAELYRANRIENHDTIALRCLCENHVEILFYATHAVKENYGPVFSYEFEKARVTYALEDPVIRVRFQDGSVKEYGDPDAVYLQKLYDALSMAETGLEPACGPEAARSQTCCINGAQESMPEIAEFPKMLVTVSGEEGSRLTWVQGLDRILQNCYEKALLPSERCIPWSKKGLEIDLQAYTHFPRGAG